MNDPNAAHTSVTRQFIVVLFHCVNERNAKEIRHQHI